MELTPKQKRFADEYIKNGGNAAQAAKSAGYKYYEGQGRENKRKPAIKAYIAKRQAEIDKQNGTDIMSLADIQAFRARVIKGEEKDAFGLDAGLTDRLKAANDLEKALKIKEEQEEKKRQAEAAMKSKTYHMDLDIIPDTFHSVIRDIRNHKHLEYVFKGGRGSTKSSTVANMILELMKKLQKQNHMGIIFITHNLGVVAEICDRCMVVYAGEKIEEGSLEDIFDHREHPYTKGLLGSIPRLGDAGKELKSIPGNVPNPKYMPKGCKFAPRCPYASEKCREEEPGFFQIEEGHISRCWLCESGQLKTDHVEKAGD